MANFFTSFIPIFYIILSFFLAGIVKSDGTTFEDKERYDLGNGPVLYEAYYPDNEDQEIPQNLEKKLYNENPVIEKSHQQSYTENYPETRPQFDDNFNQQNYPGQDDYLATQQIPPYLNQQPILNNKIIQNNNNNNHQQRASLEDAINILINAIREKKIQAQPVYQNFQPQNNEFNYRRQNKYNFQPQNNRLNFQQQNNNKLNYQQQQQQQQQKLNYQPQNNKLNYQSNKRKLNYQTNERSLIESGKFIFPNENFGYENKINNNRRIDDNIYEARPQVISYVFTPTREPQKIQSFDPTLTRSSSFIAENEKGAGLFAENLIKMREKNLEKPRVSSIQVSQEPRHKHRHHHGEKIRSNYHKPLTSL